MSSPMNTQPAPKKRHRLRNALLLVLLLLVVVVACSVAAGGDAARNGVRDGMSPSPSVESVQPVPAEEEDQSSTANAKRKAQQYIQFQAFSRQGLYKQLQFEGFTPAEATIAVDTLGADWNEQAAKKAQQYLDQMPFSRSGLVQQLTTGEGFTPAEAEYGVSQTALG